MELTAEQVYVIESKLDHSLFLEGPAGTGKTTAGVERLRYLLQAGVPGKNILLFFPQRNLGSNYQQAITTYSVRGYSLPVSATYGGLARRILGLFWPSIADHFPGIQKDLDPTFLTLESSLYFLSLIVEPLIHNEGYFSAVVIQRNRLYSQILDNLNKSAVHSFPHTEISARLGSSWIGDPAQLEIYQQAQIAADKFRTYCIENNLLDYSLQIELFNKSIQQIPLVKDYLYSQFKFLIYDNCEEDIPVAHDLIQGLVPQLDSSLIIFDQNAGYRNFLGASPNNAISLSESCDEIIIYKTVFTASPALQAINLRLTEEINKLPVSSREISQPFEPVFSINYQPSYPEMSEWVALQIQSLIAGGVSPGDIVILAPYLSDSLRFMLRSSLSKYSISSTSHRPSRALRDEPVTQALLTMAAIAHPAWEIYPSTYEIALAFVQIFQDLDLTRAHILARQAVKNNPTAVIKLSDFDNIPPNFQDRITFFTGNLYQELLDWMNDYASKPPLPLDHFLTHLFGEMLSRAGYGFYNDLTKGRVASQIIESVNKFRLSAGSVLNYKYLQSGKEYYRMVKTGVLANQYIRSWTDLPEDDVFLSPAYTFLLNNNPVEYQFWLDIGSRGWYERIYQPLTNPHVLHRNWPVGHPWSDEEEQRQNMETLDCLTTGLIRRCKNSIFGCLTERDERGFEQKGDLLLALNKALSDPNRVHLNQETSTHE
jgi:hypothetical protein